METKFKIGIDCGGSKIEGILLDSAGNQIERKRTTYKKNYDSFIKTINSLVTHLEGIANSLCTVGIGIPGFSSKETGLVVNANSIWLNNKPFKNDLEKNLKREVKIMNDANCFTLSESTDGAGEEYKAVFGIIIGTGFGGGLSYDKKIIEGVNQVAGDWGHQPLPYPTKEEIDFKIKCKLQTCQRPLCAEQFISGIGFENNFNLKNNTNLKAPEIVGLDLKNDKRAKLEFELYEDRLARVISVMIGIFDPDVIILGGGMSNIERFYKNIPLILPKYTFSDKVRNKILKNKHGDSSGVRGAAWLWNN
jgi:fructokinase